MKKFVFTTVLGYLAYLIFTTSCANPGMPTGGDKDSIPPVVVKTVPGVNARNYKGKTVNITFDEFIISTDVATQLVVSPPLAKKPLVRTKSKTLIVDFDDQLKPNTTYSLDFKNSIADNNEKNPLENYRFSFSNGPEFDSLMVGGYVRMAQNMEPMADVMVLLHRIDSLHYFRDSIPDYIARTDEDGFYMINNIAAGKYRLYALQDADNSLTYNSSAELIAFSDSLIVPDAPLAPDSILTSHLEETELAAGEHAHEGLKYEQEPHYLLLFEEESYEQYLEDSKRERANLCQFYFDEALTDSFSLNLISPEPTPDWALFEYSAHRDSLNLWIRDTTIAKMDTLIFQVNYEVLDSMKNLVIKTDTLDLFFKKPEVREKKKKKKEEEEVKEVPHFSFKGNGKDGFDIYRKYLLEVPEPLEKIDFSMIHLYQKVDTLEEELEYSVIRDSVNMRRYQISYPWEFEEEYRLQVDSAAAVSIGGYPSNKFGQRIVIREEGYYAKIILAVSNLPGPSFVQLLKNTDKEEVVQQIAITSDGEIEFPYLNPDKFKIRLVVDRNGNGQWDTGDLEKNIQPERVVYYPKIIKTRSNFEVRETWALPDDLQFKKELIDDDQLEKDKEKGGKSGSSNKRPGGSR
ncbi:Ig-like domain-containing domain [Mangrovibacterium lignilyticum]|uniref:Ig-like domain-containing domain n=1 Tax=Mangrovibacterium lignilyticum TaxID=2668052 RepID=UPI0013D8C767|nr:Ig-like domain-containing domain [Mangrovibacterium lignilyticum]